MSKRFTATEKWEDPWFFSLTPVQKMFWLYILDRCDHAGFWLANWALVKVYIGEVPDLAPFESRRIKISEEKWFIPKFVDFQYGELNPESRTHASVIAHLKKQGVWEQYAKGIDTLKDKAKDKDLEKEGKGEPGETPKPPKPAIEIPADLTPNAAAIETWIAYRRELGKLPKGKVSWAAFWQKLRKYPASQLAAGITQSIEEGWTGLFALKTNAAQPVAAATVSQSKGGILDNRVSRALTVQRLKYHEREKLHGIERERDTVLEAHEIKTMFGGGMFGFWGIPDDKETRPQREHHLDRILVALADAGCSAGLKVGAASLQSFLAPVSDWHEFDDRVAKGIESGRINLRFPGSREPVEQPDRSLRVAP